MTALGPFSLSDVRYFCSRWQSYLGPYTCQCHTVGSFLGYTDLNRWCNVTRACRSASSLSSQQQRYGPFVLHACMHGGLSFLLLLLPDICLSSSELCWTSLIVLFCLSGALRSKEGFISETSSFPDIQRPGLNSSYVTLRGL